MSYSDAPKFAPADTVAKIIGAREALAVVPREGIEARIVARLLDRQLVLALETARDLSRLFEQ